MTLDWDVGHGGKHLICRVPVCVSHHELRQVTFDCTADTADCAFYLQFYIIMSVKVVAFWMAKKDIALFDFAGCL